MPKNLDIYIYSVQMLKNIANCYSHIYQGIEIYKKNFYKYTVTNVFEIAEYKADFDMALKDIGKGKWNGNISENFEQYKHYDKLQRIIIADIMGISDIELMKLGFYRISQIRGTAYHWMVDFLNGLPRHGTKTRFIAKPLDKVYR